MECKDCKFYKKPVYGQRHGYGGCKARNLTECPGYQEALRWGFKPRQQPPDSEHQTVAYVDDLEDPRSRGYEGIVMHDKED